MRQIAKLAEPSELVQYRNVPGSTYDGGNFTTIKTAIRRDLLRDQGYLCAYCMRRISVEDMKIEHWQSQTDFPDLQLQWSNLLGVCNGNVGQRWDHQTCDTRRGNAKLTYNPCSAAHQIESRIKYLADGQIDSGELVLSNELNQALNLNWTRLKGNRRAVIDAVLEVLGKKTGTRTRAELEKLIKEWQTLQNQMFREYCGVAIYFLKKRLARCN